MPPRVPAIQGSSQLCPVLKSMCSCSGLYKKQPSWPQSAPAPLASQLISAPAKHHTAPYSIYSLHIPNSLLKSTVTGASLMAQWLEICLPMQGTRVRALVWEDPTCRRATRPVSHNC